MTTHIQPNSQPPKAYAPLPIPDVQTHLGILRDLIYSGDRGALAKHVLSHWSAFVGAEMQAPCVEYISNGDSMVIHGVLARGVHRALIQAGADNCSLFIDRTTAFRWRTSSGALIHWEPGISARVDNVQPLNTNLVHLVVIDLTNRHTYGLLAHDMEASR